VVLLGPDGEPVEGLALAVRSAGTPFGSETAPTDADGHTTVFGPPGTVVLRARRRALRADAAFYAWLRSPDRPPTDDGLVDVGSIVLEPDPADPATVRLPSIW
jgi:hypothetical protein